jgi:Tfp pilus assembly protein FimT
MRVKMTRWPNCGFTLTELVIAIIAILAAAACTLTGKGAISTNYFLT